MKKINKSQPPNVLTEYALQNPTAEWESGFRQYNQGQDYKQLRDQLIEEQGGICAYCEEKIVGLTANKQRVEHYHSKSDKSDPAKNWGLDWFNLLAVCIGGNDADKKLHPLPDNLSCDSFKGHLIDTGKLSVSCEQDLLNPLGLPTQLLVKLDKATGKLGINTEVCLKIEQNDPAFQGLTSSVKSTLENLNLNCQRLQDNRLEVLKRYNMEVAKYRKANDKQGLQKLAERWFSQRWPSYFSTRRYLLGAHAERYLQQITYNG